MISVQIKTEPGVLGNPQQMCRLCMSKESLDDLFKEKGLHQWIADFLSIQITTEDRFSKAICAMCRQRLIEFHHFRLRSQEVQTVLQSMVQDENGEPEKEVRGRKPVQETKEHKCIRCGKAFSKRHHLDKHVKIHKKHGTNGGQNKINSSTNIGSLKPRNETRQRHPGQHPKRLFPVTDGDPSIGNEDMIDIVEVKIEAQTRTEDDVTLPGISEDPFLTLMEIDPISDQSLPEKEEMGTNDSFQCNKCHKMLQSGRALWGHYRAVHGPKNHTCRICEIAFPFLKELKKHEATNKHINKLKELQENKKFSVKEKLLETKKNQTETEKASENSPDLNQHTIDNNDNRNQSSKPDRALKRKRQLKNQDVESEEQTIDNRLDNDFSIVDDDADYRPANSSSAQLLQGLVSDEQLRCDICHEVFSNEKKLMLHKKYHGSKTYDCPKCGKTFRNRFVLQEHISSHGTVQERKRTKPTAKGNNAAKPYECAVCHKVFKLLSSLRNHRNQVHGARVHECHICGSKFATRFDLGWHMKIHYDQSDER